MKKIIALLLCILITTGLAATKKGDKVKIDSKISIYGLEKGVVYVFDNKSDCIAFMRIGVKCLKYKGKRVTLFKSYKKKLHDFLDKKKTWTAVKIATPFILGKWSSTVVEIKLKRRVEVSSGKMGSQDEKGYIATLDTWRPKASGSVGGGGC